MCQINYTHIENVETKYTQSKRDQNQNFKQREQDDVHPEGKVQAQAGQQVAFSVNKRENIHLPASGVRSQQGAFRWKNKRMYKLEAARGSAGCISVKGREDVQTEGQMRPWRHQHVEFECIDRETYILMARTRPHPHQLSTFWQAVNTRHTRWPRLSAILSAVFTLHLFITHQLIA